MGQSRGNITSPVLRSSQAVSTLEGWFTGVRLHDPCQTRWSRLFPDPHDPVHRDRTAQGGWRLAPAGRPRRVDPSLSHAASHAHGQLIPSLPRHCCITLMSMHQTRWGAATANRLSSRWARRSRGRHLETLGIAYWQAQLGHRRTEHHVEHIHAGRGAVVRHPANRTVGRWVNDQQPDLFEAREHPSGLGPSAQALGGGAHPCLERASPAADHAPRRPDRGQRGLDLAGREQATPEATDHNRLIMSTPS
jgi:hypothetical protein